MSVLATAAVAIAGFRISRSTNRATLDAARDTNQATIDAAHNDVRRTLDATRDGQIADRYTRAIEQLGSSTIDVAIGGIYALERIALDSPRDHPTVIEVLSAYIREHSREQWPRSAEEPVPGPPERITRPDIQAAITVIGRRDSKHDDIRRPIDLAGVNLSRASLIGADLAKANLTHADLTDTKFADGNLTDARLTSVNLSVADLTGAHLIGADLTEADLTGAHLIGADLGGANLTRAEFYPPNLTQANLTHADLTSTSFKSADLTQARLIHAKISRPDFSGTKLDDVDFNHVVWPDNLRVPKGWKPDPNSRQLSNPEKPPPRRASPHPIATRYWAPEKLSQIHQEREQQREQRRQQHEQGDSPSS